MQNEPRASFNATRSPSLFAGQGAAFNFQLGFGGNDLGGDDFGGGFDDDEQADQQRERTPNSGPPRQAVDELEDRPRDLGVGTSAQGAARSAAQGSARSDEASAGGGSARRKGRMRGDDGRWIKKRRGLDGTAISPRRTEKVPGVEPLGPLGFDEHDVDDDLPLAHARPVRRRGVVLQRFTRTRTAFSQRRVVVRPQNPFDEERLAEHFPEAVELVDPDKAETVPRRTYRLDKFWVHERDDPSTLVPLDRLLRFDGQALPDVVIVGLARPHASLDAPRHAESRHRADRPGVVEAREVRLVARWDVRSLSFAVNGGPRLVSRLADYYLVTPRQPAVRKGKRQVAPLPRRGSRRSPPPLFDLLESYEPHVRLFRRLLNLYVFARTHSIRGNYVPEGGLDEDEDEDNERREASKVVDDILCRIEAGAQEGDLAWQDELPAFWRWRERDDAREQPKLDSSHKLLVFRALPDLPLYVFSLSLGSSFTKRMLMLFYSLACSVTPDIYKIVAPFFPRHMFRTDDVDRAEHDKERDKRTASTNVNKYRAVVQADLETQDDPAESVGRCDVKTSPAFVNDRSLTDKVRMWKSAVVNDVTYQCVPPSWPCASRR